MFGYDTPSLLLLHALNARKFQFDPTLASHAKLLDLGLVVVVKGQYHAMPTEGFYEAMDFESTRNSIASFGALQVVGVPETPGVAVREFGVDLTTGREVPVETTHRVSTSGIRIEGEEERDDSPSFPATPLDPADRPEMVAYAIQSDFPGIPDVTDCQQCGDSVLATTEPPVCENCVVEAQADAPAVVQEVEQEELPWATEDVTAAAETCADALESMVDEMLPCVDPNARVLIHHPESDSYLEVKVSELETLDPLCVDVTGIPEHEAEFQRRVSEQIQADSGYPVTTPGDAIPTSSGGDAPEGHTEDPISESATPDIDDTMQWERTIGDLPQAFEELRPAVRMLVRLNMADPLFTKIYSAAFQAKEVARSRDFIKLFNEELPVLLNEKGETVNAWFESWIHDLTKRVLTFDGSEEVQAAFRAIMKFVPDDRKQEISDYLQKEYINKGIGRFFPEAVRRHKEAATRTTIAKPVSWILKTAESINEQAEKEMKRPPQADPALIEHAIDLMPAGTDRATARERLMHRLAIGNGISMDEILSAWETEFTGKAQPALRYSWVYRFLDKNGKLYLNTEEAITLAAKEIIWHLMNFVQHPVDEPIGAQTWQESNAAQVEWIRNAANVLDDHPVYEKAWAKFIDENWQGNKARLLSKNPTEYEAAKGGE